MSGELEPDRRELRASHDDRDQTVERLREAAGDGRLDAEELDERLEAALTARTYGELEKLVVDLPATPGTVPTVTPAHRTAKDVVELRSHHGSIQRVGPWLVPRRLDVETRSGNVVVDFTQAVVTHPTLDVTIAVRSGNVVLVVPPDIGVDVDSVTVRSGNISHRSRPEPGTPLRLLINVTGHVRSGNITVRGPRRGFWARLRRRRTKP